MKATFFYADDRLVASTNPGWLQSEFYTLTGIFGRVGLQKRIRRTVGMIFQPCRESRVRADEAYTRWMMGEVRSFKEIQQERFL